MTCTKQQIGILMKNVKLHGKAVAAAKAGMSPKTASKYIKNPNANDKLCERDWRTRGNPFKEHWDDIMALLNNAPGLEAKTIMDWLITKYPKKYKHSQLRTLQRHCKQWRALKGPEKEVIFPQIIKPGAQSQSDCTYMNKLNITINGEPFPHLLFHFMLPYSRWETVSICYSESFDSLTEGYELAVTELGAVAAEHRTDNLSAATHKMGSSREFNDSWESFLKHYRVTPSRNNPGESHENGSVEKSHDLFKKTVDQQLMLRGSRDFVSIEAYEVFLNKVKEWRNHGREERLNQEYKILKSLPECRWNAPKMVTVRVSCFSTVKVAKSTYSVPSRLIGVNVRAYIYPAEIKLHYGDSCVHAMPKLPPKSVNINYRHVISRLVRKPGAFANYQYREHLFPRLIFRKAYDALVELSPSRGHVDYLKLLHLAAITNEMEVCLALELLLESSTPPKLEQVKNLLDLKNGSIPSIKVNAPDLQQYDCLLQRTGLVEVSNASIH